MRSSNKKARKVIIPHQFRQKHRLTKRNAVMACMFVLTVFVVGVVFLVRTYNPSPGSKETVKTINQDIYSSGTDYYREFKVGVKRTLVGVKNILTGTGSGLDTDQDGISDNVEMSGLPNQFGKIIFTNPLIKDTDGDGVDDGEEVELIRTKLGYIYYQMKTDPSMVDTDGDWFGDREDIDPLNYDIYDGVLDRYIEEKYPDQLTLTFVVDQPNPGTRKSDSGDGGGGHSFIRFEKYTKTVNGAMSKQVFYRGFYPDSTGMTEAEERIRILGLVDMPGKVGYADAYAWNIAKVFPVDDIVADQIINQYLPLYEKKSFNYQSNNCTTFAVEAFAINHINLPIKEHSWKMSTVIRMISVLYDQSNPFIDVFGYNPADAGEDIRDSGGYIEYRLLKQ